MLFKLWTHTEKAPHSPPSRASYEVSFVGYLQKHIDVLMQERRNPVVNAPELRLSCTNPSISKDHTWKTPQRMYLSGHMIKSRLSWLPWRDWPSHSHEHSLWPQQYPSVMTSRTISNLTVCSTVQQLSTKEQISALTSWSPVGCRWWNPSWSPEPKAPNFRHPER